MEILYIKSESVMLSLSGEVCGDGQIKISCADEKASFHTSNGFLYKDKVYKLSVLNLSGEKIKITANGKEIALDTLCGAEEFLNSNLIFDRAGENNIKVFLQGTEFADVRLEVCAENENYKAIFYDMKADISRIAKEEVLTYLKAECEKENVEINKDGKTACEMILPTFEKIISFLKNDRKYYKGNLFKTNPEKRNGISKFKSINIYNTKENRKIKSTAVKFENLLDNIISLCADEERELKILKDNIKTELEKSVVFMAEAKYEKINIDGSFCKACFDKSEQMYKFFCFAVMNEILSQMYLPLESEIFSAGFDIYKRRETKYINTENDNVITFVYDIAEDKPEIFMKINRRERVTSHRRVYLFKPIYKMDAGGNESDIAYKYNGMYKKGFVEDVYALCFSKSADYKNIVSLSPYDKEEIKNLIKSILGDCDLNEYPPFEDVVCNASKEEFLMRDVLVAVVKTKSQFNTNIKEKFYYIPARFIEDCKNIRYVALYQSKALFGAEAGIKYFGEVEKIRSVPRYKIFEVSKNSDELYYRFDVKSWKALENKIKPKEFAEVCMFTNMFLLKTVKEFPELYINSFLEYILCLAEENVNFRFENAFFKCRKENVTVYLKSGQTVTFSRRLYKEAAPKIEEMLGKQAKVVLER